MSYTAIANSEIDGGSPGTETLFTKIRDNFLAGGVPYTAGDYIVKANDTERTVINASYTKLKEIKIDRDGAYRVLFDLKSVVGGGYAVEGKVYKNGSAIGTERSESGGTYDTFTEDFSGFLQGDLIQIYGKAAANGVAVTNFRLACAEEGALSGY